MTKDNQQENSGKYSILFVCLGNICRSPAAEGIIKKMIRDDGLESLYRVDSAGIGGWHVGELPDSRMRRHCAAHGYRLDSRARQFADSDFGDFDLIVTMDAENYANISRRAPQDGCRAEIVRMADFLASHPGQHTIPDPYYGGDNGFELVVELLEDACRNLLDRINEKLTDK